MNFKHSDIINYFLFDEDRHFWFETDFYKFQVAFSGLASLYFAVFNLNLALFLCASIMLLNSSKPRYFFLNTLVLSLSVGIEIAVESLKGTFFIIQGTDFFEAISSLSTEILFAYCAYLLFETKKIVFESLKLKNNVQKILQEAESQIGLEKANSLYYHGLVYFTPTGEIDENSGDHMLLRVFPVASYIHLEKALFKTSVCLFERKTGKTELLKENLFCTQNKDSIMFKNAAMPQSWKPSPYFLNSEQYLLAVKEVQSFIEF